METNLQIFDKLENYWKVSQQDLREVLPAEHQSGFYDLINSIIVLEQPIPNDQQHLFIKTLSNFVQNATFRSSLTPICGPLSTFILKHYVTDSDLPISDFLVVVSCIKSLISDAQPFRESILTLSLLRGVLKYLDTTEGSTDLEMSKPLAVCLFACISFSEEACEFMANVERQLVIINHLKRLVGIIKPQNIDTVKSENFEFTEDQLQHINLILNIFFSYLRNCQKMMDKMRELEKANSVPSKDVCSSCTLGKILRFILIHLYGNTKYNSTMQSISSLISLIPKCGIDKILLDVSKDSDGSVQQMDRFKYICGTEELPPLFMNYDVRPMAQILSFIFEIIHKPPESMQPEEKTILIVIFSALNVASRKCFLIRKYLRRVIFPPIQTARIKPEAQENFRGYMVRMIRNTDEKLGNITADFLFTLCRRNLSRMVKHCGMVNLLGFLMSVGLFGNEKAVDEEELKYLNDTYGDESDESELEECTEEVEKINDMLGAIKEDDSSENGRKETSEEIVDKLTKLGFL